MFRCCFTDDAGGNKQKTAVKDTARLDRETEELKRTLFSPAVTNKMFF